MQKLKFTRRWHCHAQGSRTLVQGQARCGPPSVQQQESRRYGMREAALSRHVGRHAAVLDAVESSGDAARLAKMGKNGFLHQLGKGNLQIPSQIHQGTRKTSN
ncbi:hypothetical protein HAX54_021189 [Datura stramonium]|uniref:Uncharacterized protein n=1 Tax=Datura stramonium TaxID=4076 RepID=A0ABS8UUR7_DATST|nr:hypothetical protein [Datura stramonium]